MVAERSIRFEATGSWVNNSVNNDREEWMKGRGSWHVLVIASKAVDEVSASESL